MANVTADFRAMPRQRLCRLLAGSAALTLAACGGGGSSSPAPAVSPPPPPTTSGPTWQSGVFAPASDFKDVCQAVRPASVTDADGNSYPDLQGDLIDELFWLRSWTDETYLWYDEVTDQDPATFADRLSYFEELRTFAVEPSGEERDDFHFSQSTEDYVAQVTSAASPGYGAEYAFIRTTPPRDLRIAFTEPGTPASASVGGVPNLIRGSKIIAIDGIDAVNGNSQQAVDTLNNALFPSAIGQTHTFEIEDPGSTATRTIELSAAAITAQPVNLTSVIDTPNGKVGYIVFTTFSPFSSEKQIIDAMQQLADENVDDLVLDLRYNGGGLLAVAAQLGYMIAGDTQTQGKAFQRLRFNDKAGNRNPVTGTINDPFPFVDEALGFTDDVVPGTPLPSLDLGTVYILSTGGTCSASEAVINGLRAAGVEVVLIGDTTCGKPYGFYPTDNCGETYYTIQFQVTNNDSFGDYADGFVPNNSTFPFGVKVPGCQVSDDFSNPLGDTSERLLEAALQYRADGTCPAPTVAQVAPTDKDTVTPDGLAITPRPKPPLSQTYDLSMPRRPMEGR